MDTETLHQIRIGILVQIVAPEKRCMVCCEDRIIIAFVDTISFYLTVLFCNKSFMLGLQPLKSIFESHILLIKGTLSGRAPKKP